MGGERIRKALDLTSWEAGQERVRDWEARGSLGGEIVEVERAVADYLADCAARKLAPESLRKFRVVLERQFEPWCREKGYRFLAQVRVPDVRAFRESWEAAPATSLKKLEILRSFFRFAVESGWTEENPAKLVRSPTVNGEPTEPFTDAEMAAILAACGTYPTRNSFGYDNRARVRAFVLLLRHSGLRISDATAFDWSKLTDNKLFLYQHKTKHPVWCPLPPEVTNALDKVRDLGERPFWSGEGKLLSGVTHWQRCLRRVFRDAGIVGGHPHRFRDTFAVALLEKSVPLEIVSVLLGHSDLKVTWKHYAPWVKSRQVALEEQVRRTWA